MKKIPILIFFGLSLFACQQTNYDERFSVALHQENIKEVETILKEGKIELDSARIDGRLPLEIAVERGNLMLVETLLKFGAHANSKSFDGTPLIMVASNPQIVNVLVQYGAVNESADVKVEVEISQPKKIPITPIGSSTKYICLCGTACKVRVLSIGTGQQKIQFLEPCEGVQSYKEAVLERDWKQHKQNSSSNVQFNFLQGDFYRAEDFNIRAQAREKCEDKAEGEIVWTSKRLYDSPPDCEKSGEKVNEWEVK